ncbi:MAG: N-acetyl-D-myo-inositol-2-amino-2-deoxy-alpha-D-glucopyranoside deacetylase [Nocardioidaceae bacterium]|nr:N-acetyl-D-myo-inositol-2-amino-2-deoxy-alpha-D-glucopyranoside deacetylase [Nocardioidaceae bacterium]
MTRVDVSADAVGTLLGVWAHPDDEAYLSSGLMAHVRRGGGRVVVVTATRGEHGTDDPETWPPERLAPHREQELRDSLAVVGVHEHRWLPYRDGELASLPLATGAAGLVEILDEVRPDTIVTFGPEGMTGHDDHRTISAWTTEAWRLTGHRGDLWYATLTPEFHDEWGHLNDEVGLWFAGRPPSTPRSELAAQVHLSGRWLSQKHRALQAHASQTGPLEALVGSSRYRSWWADESFVPAARAEVALDPDGDRRLVRPPSC